MRIVTASDIDHALDPAALIDALDAAFRADITVPMRHHHTIPQPDADGTMLIMPAWSGRDPEKCEAVFRKDHAQNKETTQDARFIGCKIATILPDNAKLGKPSLYGQYLLLSGESGEPLAVIDGRVLTAWRTGAASALAARYLARKDAKHLVMIGAGALAPHLIRSHLAVRPIERVTLWNRSRARAISTAFALAASGIEIDVTDDLQEAVRQADIVSCATLATEPFLKGDWLKAGTHVDLVGSFTPKMREADDRVLTRGRLYVDTRGALKEAGDLTGPLRRKVIKAADVQGDLFELCRKTVKGRRTQREITVFKSAGTAVEDFAAAVLVWQRLAGDRADKAAPAG
ncbi:MAG: ornithine cyclodeaminase family protein [Pseudolabrys sp.]|nr:ornithine cyclodeaminase family protein [Pseudolabrys sp.]